MEPLRTGDLDIMSSESWAEYFAQNAAQAPRFPYEGGELLFDADRELVFPSICMFQAGEASEGHHLMEAVRAWCVESGDSAYEEAMCLFVAEENRHSQYLKRYMDRHGVTGDKVALDGVFRRLRRGGGLEREVTVLVTAEMIALSYYSALAEATGDPLLKAICAQMQHDELHHVVFQSATLRKLGPTRGGDRRRRLLMEATCMLVWLRCKDVLCAGGYGWQRFHEESMGYLEQSILITRTGHAYPAKPVVVKGCGDARL